MNAAILYFVTDDQGNHLMTAPLSTIENIFGLRAGEVMMLSREPDREHEFRRHGRRLMDRTIRVRRVSAATSPASSDK